ncbi:hypothetical protein BDZ91DRAFT_723896 [Kalaharituber pfeilii]|nr:hypothetical protein BDZ91DRAFT_723896 [Kalaharituber pfeilii]
MTRRIHEDHQLFLGQQDILGTFYDTLSIFQSVPLFTRLEKIRMVDFDWPEPLSKMPPSRGHATAFARGFWSIVKTIAIVKPQCLPCLKTWEIDRFDYEVFLPYLLDEREQVDNDDGRSQFHTAISRLSVFRIRNVMSTDMYTVHGYGAQILTEALLLSGSKLQELSITDATNEHILPYSAFPFGFNEHLPFHRPELGTSGSMLVNLRKLELKGHRTIDIVTFAGMIMSLPPGVLQELGLDSLGLRDGVLWANFFRFIAPKTEWADATEEWQGSFMHYRIQSHILARTNADIDLFANDVEQLWTLQNNSQSKQHIRENVWRGLKLQKCILRALVDIPREHSLPGGGLGDVYADARPISHFELRKFERWMVKGLDTSEYCAIWLEL